MEVFERRISALDGGMIVLAVASVALLVYDELAQPGDPWRTRILYADLVVVLVFAVEFLVRISQAERKANYALRHWYDLVGMVPALVFAHPALRAFRLARLLRLVAIASRFLRLTDRTFGDAFVHRTLDRYRSIFVEELTTPVMLSALGMTERALLKGRYGTAIANGLSVQRESIVDHVRSQMERDGTIRVLLKAPGVGRSIDQLPGRVLDGVIETLASPEMDEAIRGILQQVLNDLREDVSVRSWRQKAPDASAA